MKIEEKEIIRERHNSNKNGVYFETYIDVSDCEDYEGKNPVWVIFYIEEEDKYKLRWKDYDGWRQPLPDENGNDPYTFDTWEKAAEVLRGAINQETMLITLGGYVKHG